MIRWSTQQRDNGRSVVTFSFLEILNDSNPLDKAFDFYLPYADQVWKNKTYLLQLSFLISMEVIGILDLGDQSFPMYQMWPL